MDDTIYATSFTLYSLPLPTPIPLLNLLSSPAPALQARAAKLHDYLASAARRPAYEGEEEREKIGALRGCECVLMQGEKGVMRGVVIGVLYEKVGYRFVFYTGSGGGNGRVVGAGVGGGGGEGEEGEEGEGEPQLPLLLVKANASLTKRVFAFLADTLRVEPQPQPMRLQSQLLLDILHHYVARLRTALDMVADTESLVSLLRDIIGTLRITLTVNTASARGGEIAKALKAIDVALPPETLQLLLREAVPPVAAGVRARKKALKRGNAGFLDVLRKYVYVRTGLRLPVAGPVVLSGVGVDGDGARVVEEEGVGDGARAVEEEGDREWEEPLVRVTRVHCVAFAVGAEGRVKFSARPVEMMDVVPGLSSGEENVVRVANGCVLEALVREAERVAGGELG